MRATADLHTLAELVTRSLISRTTIGQAPRQMLRNDFEEMRCNSEIEREALIAKIQVFPLVFLSTKGSR
jgi:hypothetical protein